MRITPWRHHRASSRSAARKRKMKSGMAATNRKITAANQKRHVKKKTSKTSRGSEISGGK